MNGYRNPIPEAAEWAERLDLIKLSARHFAGPCPLCGGHDRFHVTQGIKRTLIGCRGCIDTEETTARRKRFGELLRLVFPELINEQREHNTRVIQGRRTYTYNTNPPPRNDRPEPSPELPNTLWSLSLPIIDTPGETYLIKRHLWPPEKQSPFPIPDCIGWLSQEQTIKPEPGWAGLPKQIPGALIFNYRRGADITSVHLIGIKKDGNPLHAPHRPKWRCNAGSPRGAYCIIPALSRVIDNESSLIISEGITTALACSWLHPGYDSMSIGSLTNANKVEISFLEKYKRIIINTDGDENFAGHPLGLALYDRLNTLNQHPIIFYRTQGDAADEIARTMETYGPALWNTFITIHQTLNNI